MPLSVLTGSASASKHGNERPMRIAKSAGNNRCALIGRQLWHADAGRTRMSEVPATPLSSSPTYDDPPLIRSPLRTHQFAQSCSNLLNPGVRACSGPRRFFTSVGCLLHQFRAAASSQGGWRLWAGESGFGWRLAPARQLGQRPGSPTSTSSGSRTCTNLSPAEPSRVTSTSRSRIRRFRGQGDLYEHPAAAPAGQ